MSAAEPLDIEPRVIDEFDAQRKVRALRALKRERARFAALADAARAEADEFERTHTESIDRDIAYIEANLRGYMEMRVADNPKLRSIPVVGGTLKWRVSTVPTVTFTDEAAYIEWALKGQPEKLLQHTETVKPLKQALKDADWSAFQPDGTVYDATSGEVIPGVLMVVPEPSFSVALDAEAVPEPVVVDLGGDTE